MRNLCLIAAAYYLLLTGVTQLLLSGRPIFDSQPDAVVSADALAAR
jgi:hypothetical protein